MIVAGIDHISINTSDIGASVEFYGKVMGLRELERVVLEGFSIVYFEVPGGARLELFDYGGANPRVHRGDTDVGLRHLAFEVDDVDEVESFLRDRGVTITLPATDLPALGSRVLLFQDPNGVTLECCQKLD